MICMVLEHRWLNSTRISNASTHVTQHAAYSKLFGNQPTRWTHFRQRLFKSDSSWNVWNHGDELNCKKGPGETAGMKNSHMEGFFSFSLKHNNYIITIFNLIKCKLTIYGHNCQHKGMWRLILQYKRTKCRNGSISQTNVKWRKCSSVPLPLFKSLERWNVTYLEKWPKNQLASDVLLLLKFNFIFHHTFYILTKHWTNTSVPKHRLPPTMSINIVHTEK